MSAESLSFEILPSLAHASLDAWIWVDVRTESEFHDAAGHIAQACLVPLGMPLLQFLEKADPSKSYLFVCAHGYRSAKAAQLAIQQGCQHAKSLKGGMQAWISEGFPVEVTQQNR